MQIYNVLVGADMSANKNKNEESTIPDFKLAVGSVSEPEPAYDRQQVPGIYEQVSSGVSLDPRGVEYMENSQPYGYQVYCSTVLLNKFMWKNDMVLFLFYYVVP